MSNEIKVTANVTKVAVDAKKTVVTLELAEECYRAIPELARLAGMWATATFEDDQLAMNLEGDDD